jgi:tetratricopeptide (TPR) repeat protein
MEEIRKIAREVIQLLYSNPKEALRLAEMATDMAATSADPLDAGIALRAKGAALSRCNQNVASIDCFDRALTIFENEGDALEVTKTMMNRFNAYLLVSRFDEALADSEIVTAAYRDGGEDSSLAKHLINVGHIFFRLDRFEENLQCLDQAEAILKRINQSQDLAHLYLNRAVALTALNRASQALHYFNTARQVAFDYNMPAIASQADYNICYLHFMQGRYTSALDGLAQVRAKMVELEDRWHTALCDLDRTEIYLNLNMYSDALELASLAKPAFEELQMEYEAGKATVFMAIASSLMGNTTRGKRLFDQARRIFESNGNSVWVAIIDLYEATINFRSNRFRKAEILSKSAYEVLHGAGLHGKAVHAALLCARSAMKLGKNLKALQYVFRAQTKWREAPTAWVASDVFQVAGDALAATNDKEGALLAYSLGIRELEYLRANIGVDHLRAMFLGDKLSLYESMVTLQLSLGKPVHEVFDTVERAKSRTLLDHIAASVGAMADPPPGSAVEELKRLREELNWYYRRLAIEEEKGQPLSNANIQRLLTEIQMCELRFRRVLRDAPSNVNTPLRSITPFKLDDVRSAIPHRTAIIEYFATEGRFVALVMTNDGVSVSKPLCSIDQLLLIRRLLSFQFSRMSVPLTEYPQSGNELESTQVHLHELYMLLIQPLEELIGAERDALVLVPHGLLHHVPLHAAFDGSRYLIDRYTVSYAPSASVFHACASTEVHESGRPLVAGIADRRSPWIEHEVRELGNLLPEAQVFLGTDATEANVLDHAPSASIVHIASHGHFRTDNAIFSSIELSDSSLSLFDIYRLRMSARLVVLSGCSTGMSNVLPGDELFGFARGFLYAGVPAVVLSLWNVNDLRSADLMVHFYKNLVSGLGTAKSLQLAMTTVRQQAPHPYYWAPFVVVGKPN